MTTSITTTNSQGAKHMPTCDGSTDGIVVGDCDGSGVGLTPWNDGRAVGVIDGVCARTQK